MRALRPVLRALALCLIPCMAFAQGSTQLSREVRRFIVNSEPVTVFKNIRVIDGTGAPARDNQTVIFRDGIITAVGDAESVTIPPDESYFLAEGMTLFPGYVMLHEHMFYPAGDAAYNEMVYSFPRLYLAGGATTVRTTGSMVPYADLNLRRAIDAGEIPGPKMDVTAPYLNGPGLPILGVKVLRGPDDARRMVGYWADEGMTSFKAYMQISRAELRAAIEEAHRRGFKLTGHLCSVTYREAADLGIDDLEHGFFAATDFVPDKRPDECPPSRARTASLLDLDVDGPEAQALIQHLVEKGVAITSTLPVFETYAPGRPPVPDVVLDAMLPEARDQYLRSRARTAVSEGSPWAVLFKKGMELEYAFARAGGLLVVGTDPTGYGGVVAGFSNQRAIELLVEAGFTPEEAISIGTLNGAKYLGLDDTIGTIEVGKVADLVLVGGNPSENIQDVRNVEFVYKDGIGYDADRLIESVKGTVGLR